MIIFLAMVFFLGLFVDLARIKAAENQLARAVNAAARSVLADYDASLKDKYHLFAHRDLASIADDYQRYLALNLSMVPEQTFSLWDYELAGIDVTIVDHLWSQEVLRQQILEEMKYRAPLKIAQDLLDKFGPLLKFSQAAEELAQKEAELQSRNEALERVYANVLHEAAEDETEEQRRRRQEAVEQDLRTIRAYENRIPERLEVDFEGVEADLDPKAFLVSVGQPVGDLSGWVEEAHLELQEKNRIAAVPSGIQADAEVDQNSALYRSVNKVKQREATERVNLKSGLFGTLRDVMAKLKNPAQEFRDQLYINEYAVTFFKNFTGGGEETAEVEQIITGLEQNEAVAKVKSRIWGWRFVFDSLGYLLFCEVTQFLPVIPKLVYAAVMGAQQASYDTYKLFQGREVRLVEVQTAPRLIPKMPRVNYLDYLRLLLLVDGEGEQLANMQTVMNRHMPGALDKGTRIKGKATVSIRLWFLPLAGISNLERGPFGTSIEDGRCYLTRYVEYAY